MAEPEDDSYTGINQPKINTNPLLDRIFDKGIGGKFNEFSTNSEKPKTIKGFLNNYDEIQNLHNDPNYITNHNNNFKNNPKNNNHKSKPKANHLLDLSTKINVMGRKVDPIVSDSRDKSNSQNIQELESITGFKTMNQLPPTRGGTPWLIPEKNQNSLPLDPKLSRPTTTIISLTKSTLIINKS